MQGTRQRRSNRLGIAFLGVAVLLTIITLFLALTNRSLADLAEIGPLSDDESDSVNQTLAEASATMTAAASETPTPQIPQIPADLDLTAEAAFVLNTQHEAVLFERNADLPLQPASTAKIFTALVVLNYASPDEVIEVLEEDVVDPVLESNMGLRAGDRLTVHDLLVGLMLPSGNDAANALARTIGARIDGPDDQPGPERFIAEMNRVASDLGLESINLRNPAGLDREGQVVTARELAVAAEALLQRPSLMAIVAMTHAEIMVGGDNSRVITVENTNELLVHDGVHGVKTGTTDEAGECMVVAYRDGSSTIIAVVLNSENRYGDARSLLGLADPPGDTETPAADTDSEHPEPVEDPAPQDDPPQT